jgi:hypothetical protein
MLKSWLLATTILIVVGSVSFSTSEAGGAFTGQAPLNFGNHSRDRNSEFLCTYGYNVFYTAGRESGSSYIYWRQYAVPITGKGTAVTEIIVTDEPRTGSSSFKVGIYTNSGGKPGGLIADGHGKAKGSCLLTTATIPKTFLAAGKRYWVVETAPLRSRGTNSVIWGYKPKAKQNAYYQSYSANSSSSSLSDWLPVSGPAPFAQVK